MGDYHVIFDDLVGMTGCRTVAPPPITRRTLEIGTLHAPDSVCVPFKYNLGNYIQAIENGANVIFTSAGGCRFEYYCECHKQILDDLGYKVKFIKTSLDTLYYDVKSMNPEFSKLAYYHGFMLQIQKLNLMDRLGDILRKRIGFETQSGSYEKFWRQFLIDIRKPKNIPATWLFGRRAERELRKIPFEKPENPLKVGIVGELYMIMEPFSNFYLEKTLGKMGVEVHRWITLSSILHHGVDGSRAAREFFSWVAPYVKYHLGAHGTESASRMAWMLKNKYDGIIHVKPFGCMPEINAMPAMYKMSRDFNVPLVCFSFDSHTSEAGVKTRLEAFYDMIYYKKQGILV